MYYLHLLVAFFWLVAKSNECVDSYTNMFIPHMHNKMIHTLQLHKVGSGFGLDSAQIAFGSDLRSILRILLASSYFK